MTNVIGDKTLSKEFADRLFRSKLPESKKKQLADDVLYGRKGEDEASQSLGSDSELPKDSYQEQIIGPDAKTGMSGAQEQKSEIGIFEPEVPAVKPPMVPPKPNIVKERLLSPRAPQMAMPQAKPLYESDQVPSDAPKVEAFAPKSLKEMMKERDDRKVRVGNFLMRDEDLSGARDNTLANSLISSSLQSGLAGIGKVAKTDLSGQSNALEAMNKQAAKAESDQMNQRKMTDARVLEADKFMPDPVKNAMNEQKFQQSEVSNEKSKLELADFSNSLRDKAQTRDPNSAVSISLQEALVNTMGLKPEQVAGKSAFELGQIQGLWADKTKADATAAAAATSYNNKIAEMKFQNDLGMQRDAANRDAEARIAQAKIDAKGEAGTGKAPPLMGQEIVKDVAAMKSMLKEFDDITKLKPLVDTGPLASAGRAAGPWVGIQNSPEAKDLKLKTSQNVAEYIKSISGATVSEQERKELLKQIPHEGMNDDQFDSALKILREKIITKLNNTIKSFQQAGYNTGSVSGVSEQQPVATGGSSTKMKASELP